jgi:hypothetical protein
MPRTAIDMAGHTYGRATVIARLGTSLNSKATWLCRCSCSNEFVTEGTKLRNGNTQSCGCIKAERAVILGHARRTHGQSGDPSGGQTRTYTCWANMKQRCHNPKVQCYEHYGLIGVTVCPRWNDDFAAFLSDMGEVPEGLSLDRIDPWDDYRPGNCRWATPLEQSNNQRRHHPRPSSEPGTAMGCPTP